MIYSHAIHNLYKLVKSTGWCLLIFCLGCSHKPAQPPVHISLVNNNQSVKFKGLDYAIIGDISRDSVPDIWQNLLPVYRMPVDTDLKDYQPIQHGTYKLIDSAIIFTPDTPFVKGKHYFMRYYQFTGTGSAWDLIKSKKRLGSLHYVDMEF